MRFLLLGLGATILLVLTGVFSYTLLLDLTESRFAANLQDGYALEEKPVVEVSSNFPPELLLGRMDLIDIKMDSFTKEGVRLRHLRINLKDVDISVPSLLQGDLEREIRAVSLVAEMSEQSINEYLRENDLGLEGGEVDVSRTDVYYRSEDALFGLPASVSLDLRVADANTIEVTSQDVTVGGLPLPPFLTEPFVSGGRTLCIGELPLGARLVDVAIGNDTLVIRAER